MNCDICGKPFLPKTSIQKRCSKECSYEAEVRQARERQRLKKGYYEKDRTRTCDICGSTFTLNAWNQRRCSDDCRAEAHRVYQKEYIENNRHRIRETAREYREKNRDKLLEGMKQWHADNREREKEYSRKRYRENPKVREKAREYKRKNRHKYTAAENKRRAAKFKAFVEDVNLVGLVKKKGFNCGVCGRLAFPTIENRYHPLRAQVDHIIPLSKGGEHSYANCQITHASCNAQKLDMLEGWDSITPDLRGFNDDYTRTFFAHLGTFRD